MLRLDAMLDERLLCDASSHVYFCGRKSVALLCLCSFCFVMLMSPVPSAHGGAGQWVQEAVVSLIGSRTQLPRPKVMPQQATGAAVLQSQLVQSIRGAVMHREKRSQQLVQRVAAMPDDAGAGDGDVAVATAYTDAAKDSANLLLGPDGKPLEKGPGAAVVSESSDISANVSQPPFSEIFTEGPIVVNLPDVFGKAFLDYHERGYADPIEYSLELPGGSWVDTELVPVDYFFRGIKDMPSIEKRALDMCRGRVLDVGCGTGIHAVHLQDQKQLEVKGIDVSPGAIEVAKRRGLKDAEVVDFHDFTGEKYDTILLLMNSIGIAGTVEGLDQTLQHAHALLNDDGQVLLDGTDISYLYQDGDKEEFRFPFDPELQYLGETLMRLGYKGKVSEFPWVFIDFDVLEAAAKRNGFAAMILDDEVRIEEGRGFPYLAKLIPTGAKLLLDPTAS